MMFGKKFGGVKLFVIARRSGMLYMILDKAARKHSRRTGTDWYRLKKLKENMRPIEFEHIVQNSYGNFAAIYSPAKGEFYPMAVTESYKDTVSYESPVLDEKGQPILEEVVINGEKVMKPKTETKNVDIRALLEPVDEDQKAFLITELDAAQARYGKAGFWEKFGPLVTIMVCGIALALIFLFWAEAAKANTTLIGGWMSGLQEAARIIQGVKVVP